jgi:hypothetical protein
LACRPHNPGLAGLPLSLLVSSMQGFQQISFLVQPSHPLHQSTCRIDVCEPGTKTGTTGAASTCVPGIPISLSHKAHIGHRSLPSDHPFQLAVPLPQVSCHLLPRLGKAAGGLMLAVEQLGLLVVIVRQIGIAFTVHQDYVRANEPNQILG